MKNNKQDFYLNYLFRESSLGDFSLEDNKTPDCINTFNRYLQSSRSRVGLLRDVCGFEVF